MDVQLRNPSIHSLSFESELYLKTIKSHMSCGDNYLKTAIYHQLQTDDGLKQICPYLVNWIQTEVLFLAFSQIGPTNHENKARADAHVLNLSDTGGTWANSKSSS